MAEEVDERRADYAAFALDPSQGGPMIEGEAEEVEEEKAEDKPEPKADAKPKADPKPEPKKPEPKAEEMPAHLRSILDRIVGDMTDATEEGHIDAILGMFEVEIGNGKSESAAFKAEIEEQIEAFRKAVA